MATVGISLPNSRTRSSTSKTKFGTRRPKLPTGSFRPACSQALPGLTGLFEVARLRLGASEKHPPQIVYVMLFGLGLGGSLLAGFGMAAATARSWIHMLIFAATLTVTLYTVTDMEYPRLGLIRIENFDHFLVDAHQQMQPRDGMATIGSAAKDGLRVHAHRSGGPLRPDTRKALDEVMVATSWQKLKEAPMVDAAYSRKLQLGRAAVGARWQLIIPLVAAFVLIGGGGWTVWAFSATKEDAPRASDVLLETTKGLEVTQQQAVDQLQIVQDQLAAQQAETKKLSKQIATLTEKLDALQQSVANIPALSVATPASLPKAQPSKK